MGYRGPFVWGLGVRPTTSPRELFCREKVQDVPDGMEAPFDGDQSPEGAIALYMEGLMRCLL